MESFLNKLIMEILDELNKEDNRSLIENCVIDPSFDYIVKKIQPYVIALTILNIVLIISITFTFYILTKK